MIQVCRNYGTADKRLRNLRFRGFMEAREDRFLLGRDAVQSGKNLMKIYRKLFELSFLMKTHFRILVC